jgi:protease-4
MPKASPNRGPAAAGLRATLAIALALPSVALAQPCPAPGRPCGETPTVGVYNPTLGVVSDADASAVEKNPALLGWLKSWSGVFLDSETHLGHPDSTVGGTGTGLFLATPLPLLRALSVGAGFQSLRPPDTFPYQNSEKLSLAVAWHIMGALSFGFSWAHVWGQHGPSSEGIDTLDLSLTMRARWLGAGLVVHDVNQPYFAGLPVQRVWEPEIVYRPFGTDVLELAVAVRVGERREDVDPRFRLWFSPMRGLHIKTDVEWKRDVDGDGIPENDVRVAMGVQLDLEHIGVSGYGLFGTQSGLVRGNGFTLAARVSGERYPAVWAGPIHLEKVQLGPGITGRKLGAMIVHLRALERDRSIAGVLVVLGDLDGGLATAEELRAALLRLRRAGKHVLVYLADTTTKGYYVAAACERIYLDPAGGLRLTGLSQTVLFYKGFGDKIGVRADFVKIAEYKSAPEAYTRTGSSEPAREQRELYLDDTYGNIVDGIAATRHVTADRVKQWIDRGPYTAVEALRAGLVDEVKTGDELDDALALQLGRHVALHDPPTTPQRYDDWMQPRIAVIHVDGDIVDGKSYSVPILDLKFVGLQSLLPAIIKAREDGRIKAIVLRVDSPGGSALASDLLARELERTKAVKPVVCSMGDLAASGGYFISAPCQRIFAAPSTLTGSIGIFTGKFDVSGLAAKLGVSFERYERGTHASTESMWRPYTDEERASTLEKLRYYYGRFVDAVARGRGLTATQVDAVGRGHIWSGRSALTRGLVDELGGLGDAIAWAKQRAHLRAEQPVELVEMPDEPSLLSTLLGLLGIDLSLKATAPEALTLVPGVRELARAIPGSLLVEPNVPHARLDGWLELR